MTTALPELIGRDGRTLATVTGWIQAQLERIWEPTWSSRLPEFQHAFDTIGEPAYGMYNRELYRPLQAELDAQGFGCDPRLPGSLPLSEEWWGEENDRERRMWTLLVDRQEDRTLGALVTRFFHDHTMLRLPRPPRMESVAQTDHDVIRKLVVQEPRTWINGAQ
jgi:hypothetical protein